jgi:enoyl-CoA hydratase/carnithine racemase
VTATLKRERLDDALEVLRLDRPASRNAMNRALLSELLDALAELAADPELRALVVSSTSAGALSSGADVAEPLDAEAGVARMQAFADLYAAIESFPVPSIAVCVGHCVGAGAELAAGCDLRVAGDNVRLAWAGARHGVPVGPARLVPLVGLSRAKDWILTGRPIGAEEAAAAGFVHEVTRPDDAEAAAVVLARRLADQHAAGVRTLNDVFRELERTQRRVARENDLLLDFQRHGAGLPRRHPEEERR